MKIVAHYYHKDYNAFEEIQSKRGQKIIMVSLHRRLIETRTFLTLVYNGLQIWKGYFNTLKL